MNKKLMDILEKSISDISMKWCPECSDYDDPLHLHHLCPVYKFNDDVENAIHQAHDQIIELWKECLPKKREVIKELYGNATNTANYGFNQAIDQAQKNMEG